MRKLVVGVALALAACIAAKDCWADTVTVTVTDNNSQVFVDSPSVGDDYDSYKGTTIPTNTTIYATLGSEGLGYSTTDIDWNTNTAGNLTTFNFDIAQQRTGETYGVAVSDGSLDFTMNVDATYSLSGFYNVANVETENGYIYLLSSLYDNTAESMLFSNYQYALNANNPSYTLGGTDGEFFDLEGSLNGSLVAGHNYTLYYYADMWANPDGDSGATAYGNVNLTVNAVPTPSALAALLGMGAVGLVGVARRRWKRA